MLYWDQFRPLPLWNEQPFQVPVEVQFGGERHKVNLGPEQHYSFVEVRHQGKQQRIPSAEKYSGVSENARVSEIHTEIPK